MKHLPTFENFLNEGITVNTSKYKGAHGKEPRGTGIWAFAIGGVEVMTPKAMSYTDAIKWAQKEAKERQVYFFEVLP
jgi:hypothetical protein